MKLIRNYIVYAFLLCLCIIEFTFIHSVMDLRPSSDNDNNNNNNNNDNNTVLKNTLYISLYAFYIRFKPNIRTCFSETRR